jgi:hypothetical protein
MFKLDDEFKSEDGYHVVELHSQDEAFASLLVAAMQAKGYHVYGFSDRGGSKQYAFVDSQFAEVLRERHHASCRNSLAGAITIPTVPAEVDPQCIGRAFRKDSHQGDVVFVDIDLGKDAPLEHTHGDRKHVANDLSPGLGSMIMGGGRLDD